MENELYIPCDCSAEVLKIEFDEETKQYFISIYEYKSNKYPISQKLRWIWHIIRYGTPYGDQIVISKEKAYKIGRWLTYE